ncbi:TerB family tellurite resistance protein [Yoonia sp. SS1-5]|uniref:TerB family tellurite resistance protein n=1 Tax=Yoonia rhodophyticola TaxID=3137370 RepID=A0AAN0NKJ2_9RHOB
MNKFLIAFTVIWTYASVLHAQGTPVQDADPNFLATTLSGLIQEDLEFVDMTKIPGNDGTMMALCHQTRGITIFDYPITNDILAYVLASNECAGPEIRSFSTEQMTTAQSLNLVSQDIPPIAGNTLQRNAQTYGVLIGAALILFWLIWRGLKALFGLNPSSPLRKKAAHSIMSALCHAAKCDGLVSSREVRLIGRTMDRLTRRKFADAEIVRLADRVHLNLTPQDYINFGKGLRDREKDVMLQAVLYITMAGGRMLPSEHKFATELAHGLGIPAEDFRRVLYQAFEDMEANPV